MARAWTASEKKYHRAELLDLYVAQNKTIGEVALVLNIKPTTVYDRLLRLDIPVIKERKLHYLNQRSDVTVPSARSERLAEFFGI
ncbi:MAG TPA: hypothetical protein VMT81_01915, partial [Candidatus Paceibacterota bacterium]|nr:hypothetical protein [Candidatus Paceibacterota bacterium]